MGVRRRIDHFHPRMLSMFPRIVSLVLIASVIACPLWCSKGLCCGDHQCSVKDQLCAVPGTLECCTESSSSDDHDPFPCGCPKQSICQGICGGAVFEKSIELDNVSDSLTQLLPYTAISFALQLTESGTFDVRDHLQCHRSNYGRWLCTQHSTFLC